MIDTVALREAIHGFTAKGEPDERNVDLNCLLDAARQFLRLKEKAETVWWCHRYESNPVLSCTPERLSAAGHESCGWRIMVEASLIVREGE